MWNLEKLIIGSFAFFAESGKTIDLNVVDKDYFPDTDPAENWEAGSMGCVMESELTTEKETDTDYCPSPNGGYIKNDDEVVVADIIKFKTREHMEPYWRLALGLNNEIEDGTAQTPFAKKRRKINGWMKFQLRGDDGSDRVVMNVWGRLELDENPKYSKDPTKPGLKFTIEYSSIATLEPDGIQAAI